MVDTDKLTERVESLKKQNRGIRDALENGPNPVKEALLDAEIAGNKAEIEALEGHTDGFDE